MNVKAIVLEKKRFFKDKLLAMNKKILLSKYDFSYS